MTTPLSVLIVEDAEADALLLKRELERGGYDVTSRRVQSREALEEALDEGRWDVLFADYTMPGFRGTEALAMVGEKGLDLPFMFVSGTIGEDVAVKAMKAGAADYFVKGQLKRLVPAVERELREAASRRERRRVEQERRAAVEALRVSEERHRLLFEHIADAILVFDREGVVSFASASVREVLGYEPDELVRGASLDLVHPDDRERARTAFRVAANRPDGLEEVEVRIEHGDGSWRDMDCVLRNLLHRPDIDGLVVTVRDVTERKRLEAEFLQAQKLESVGRLAGGIAHDFNNLLTAVLGNTDLLLLDSGLTDGQRTDLDEVRQAADRATRLTGQLLAFSRRQVLDPQPLDLNEVVDDIMPMLGRLLGEMVEVRTELEDDLGTVRADVGQMEQVLANLAVNARDAMPEGGRLSIETTNVELDEVHTEQHPSMSPGRFVQLTVSDTGVGMDEETRAHLFEPFYTTKDPGKGTGLGLATVYGIVKQSGGNIWVYTEKGSGTSFKVYLPRVEEAAKPVRDDTGPEVLPEGSETILVVEDEASVRRLAVRVLRTLGYTVLEAEHGGTALEILDERQDLDLLLTDAVLPRLDGRELADRARTLVPDLAVLFMSGYATPVLTQRGILRPDLVLLEKPFTAGSLARKVRQVLDEDAP